MRLSAEERSAITSSISALDPGAEVFLFGSRADDSLSGGDLDLLIISNRIGFTEKITLLTELKTQLGDRKIDLLVRSREEALTDPFVQSIRPTAVRI